LLLLTTLVWQILAALAPNFATVIVARGLGGLSSAGGSVTLGMVADLYDPNEQQYAVAFIVFSSVFGSVIGPLVGPFIQANLSW
jgi:MFS family permease